MQVTFTSTQVWSTGGAGVMKVKNTGTTTVAGWSVNFVPDNFSITGLWNFMLSGGASGQASSVRPQSWASQDLLPGEEVSSDFNFTGTSQPLLFTVAAAPPPPPVVPLPTGKKLVVAYYPEYGVYGRQYFPADIPVDELDVVIYAFVAPNPSQTDYNTLASNWPFPIPAADYKAPPTIPEGSIIHHDLWAAKGTSVKTLNASGQVITINGAIEGLKALKAKKPSLKIIPSVGGWSLSWTFSKIFKDPVLRKNFVDSAVKFVRDNNFDGLDIDWEFPGKQGIGYNHVDPVNDAKSLELVFKELRDAFNAAGLTDRWLIAAAGADPLVLSQYNGAAPYMDYLLVMTYDFMGAWGDGGHHSALYKSNIAPANTIPNQFWSNAAITNAKAAGFTEAKILIGSPIYGRGWAKLSERGTPTAIFSKSLSGAATTLDPTTYGEAGNSAWVSIKKEIDAGRMTPYYDESAEAAWGEHSNGSTWTYENVRSLTAKLNYMVNNNLAGIFFWDAASDIRDAKNSSSLIGTAARFITNPPPTTTNPPPTTTNPPPTTTNPPPTTTNPPPTTTNPPPTTTNPPPTTTNPPPTTTDKPVLELKNVGTVDFVLKPGDTYKIYQS